MEYIGNAKIIKSLSDLPKIGTDKSPLGGICYQVKFIEMKKDFLIFEAWYYDGELRFVADGVDIHKFSFAVSVNYMEV